MRKLCYVLFGQGDTTSIWQRWGLDQTVEVSIKSQAQVHAQVHAHRLKSQCILRTKPFYMATDDGSRTEANHMLAEQGQLSRRCLASVSAKGGHSILSNGAMKSTFLCGTSKKKYMYAQIFEHLEYKPISHFTTRKHIKKTFKITWTTTTIMLLSSKSRPTFKFFSAICNLRNFIARTTF